MSDWTKRFALSALAGFIAAVVALPISCGGLVLLNEHRYGEVASGGPEALLGGMGVACIAAVAVFLTVWRATRPR